MILRKFVLMDSTPGAAGGGDPAPAAPSAPAAPDAGASVLSAGKGSEPAPAAPAGPNDWLPEKFRVMNGDQLDLEASARKLADEGYRALEKRVGSGDLPPKAAADYAVAVPDQFKEVWQEDERFQQFRADAHAAGLTQKQFDFVVGKYFNIVPELVNAGKQVSADEAATQLREVWKTDAEFTANAQDAYRAFKAFGDEADAALVDSSPAMLKMLAKIGKEMRESGGITPQAEGIPADDVKDLMKSEAYLNPKHPEHKATAAKVQKFYQQRYGNTPVN